jgi:hypothetical protein
MIYNLFKHIYNIETVFVHKILELSNFTILINLKTKTKKSNFKNSIAFVVLFSFTSCELIGGIFKAGIGVEYLLWLLLIILFIVSKIFGKKIKKKLLNHVQEFSY